MAHMSSLKYTVIIFLIHGHGNQTDPRNSEHPYAIRVIMQ